MDAVNAFVHCDLDEVVYMKMTPGYTKKGKVLCLRKDSKKFLRSRVSCLTVIDLTRRLPDTPIAATELLPTTTIAGKPSVILYQRKMGSLLYTAIISRLDIAFVVF